MQRIKNMHEGLKRCGGFKGGGYMEDQKDVED